MNIEKSFIGILNNDNAPTVSTNALSDFENIMQEDLEFAFFGGEFNKTIKYYHSKDTTYTLYESIRTNQHEELSMGQTNFHGRSNVIRLIERKLKYTPTKRDFVFVNGEKFFVDSFEPNGVGLIDIILKR